jgi:hypothetical protein
MSIVILNNNIDNLRIETNDNGRRTVTICTKKRLIKFLYSINLNLNKLAPSPGSRRTGGINK